MQYLCQRSNFRCIKITAFHSVIESFPQYA
nr:MAG TPA: hypothetical protein [Siphoviridae sp. ctoD011]DAN97424.1 MAG TPA: hypothetical protein [Caudoviricetes sp.]DAV63666.1 MAG TPA: hypothetical protein [Caudoviricetes sp.]